MGWDDEGIEVTPPTKMTLAAPAAPKLPGNLQSEWDQGITVESPSAEVEEGTDWLSLLRSGVEGHTGGISEPIISGIKALAATPAANQMHLDTDPGTLEQLRKALEEDLAKRNAAKAAAPLSHFGAEFTGALVPTPLNVPAKIFQGVKGVSKGIQGLSLAKKAPGTAKLGGNVAESLAGGVGITGARLAAEIPFGLKNSEEAGEELKNSAAISAALPVGGLALRKAWQSGKWMSKGLFNSVFGLQPHNVQKYLEDHKAINLSPGLHEVKVRVDKAVGDLKDAFEASKLKKEDAEKALVALKAQIKGELAQASYNATEADKKASELLANAYAKTIRELEATPKPGFITPRVQDAATKLQVEIRKASEASFNKLPSNATLPKTDILRLVQKQLDTLEPSGEKSKAAIQKLNNFYKDIESAAYPTNIPMPKIKRIIQTLDKDIKWKSAPTEYMDPSSSNKLIIRQDLDEIIKSKFPEYRKAMEPLAAKTTLLSEFNKAFGFGDERKVMQKLDSPQLLGSTGKMDIDILRRLGAEVNANLLPDIEKYRSHQGYLARNRKDEYLKKKLPEYEQAQKASKLAEDKRNTFLKDQEFEKRISQSTEKSDLAEALAEFNKQKIKFEPFKRLSETTSENYINGVNRQGARKEFHKKTLKALGDMVGDNFVKDIQDRHVLESFYKNATRGSRNTLMVGAMGTALGSLAGSVNDVSGMALGGLIGSGSGAFLGRLLDESGPEMGKYLLDVFIKIKKNPTRAMNAIESSKLTPQIKQSLSNAFKYIMVKQADQSGALSENNNKAERRLKALED